MVFPTLLGFRPPLGKFAIQDHPPTQLRRASYVTGLKVDKAKHVIVGLTQSAMKMAVQLATLRAFNVLGIDVDLSNKVKYFSRLLVTSILGSWFQSRLWTVAEPPPQHAWLLWLVHSVRGLVTYMYPNGYLSKCSITTNKPGDLIQPLAISTKGSVKEVAIAMKINTIDWSRIRNIWQNLKKLYYNMCK